MSSPLCLRQSKQPMRRGIRFSIAIDRALDLGSWMLNVRGCWDLRSLYRYDDDLMIYTNSYKVCYIYSNHWIDSNHSKHCFTCNNE